MANIDKNFIAKPDFVVSTGEIGKTITLTLYPQLESVGGFQEEVWILKGWKPLYFGENFMLNVYAQSSLYYSGIAKSVLPLTYDNFLGIVDGIVASELPEQAINIFSAINFKNFVQQNPVHVKSLNLRTSNENVLPQQIIVETPNLFTGQSNRQVIDVASKKTAYQYQSGIITIDDVDIILARNSSVKFNCSFTVSNDDQAEEVIPANQLYIDITIDKYLSLEKALIMNLKNL